MRAHRIFTEQASYPNGLHTHENAEHDTGVLLERLGDVLSDGMRRRHFTRPQKRDSGLSTTAQTLNEQSHRTGSQRANLKTWSASRA